MLARSSGQPRAEASFHLPTSHRLRSRAATFLLMPRTAFWHRKLPSKKLRVFLNSCSRAAGSGIIRANSHALDHLSHLWRFFRTAGSRGGADTFHVSKAISALIGAAPQSLEQFFRSNAGVFARPAGGVFS